MTVITVDQNFTNQDTNFSYFDEVLKMRILEPKNAFWKGAKKHEVKNSSIQKMTVIKADRNFLNQVSIFF